MNSQFVLEVMERRIVSLLDSSLYQKYLKEIHAQVVQHPKLTHHLLKRLLKPPTVRYALQVFDSIALPDPYVSHTFVTSCSKLSHYREALKACFSAHRRGCQPEFFSVPAALKACALLPAYREGLQIHSFVISNAFSSSPFIDAALIDCYSKNDDLVSARKVFDCVPLKDPIAYNCLISGYVKSGDVVSAREIFDQMEERSAVSWNSMIACYQNSENVMEGLRLFERMISERVEPNERTIVSVMSMCAKLGDLQTGLRVKEMIDGHERRGELIVRTAILEMLVKGGAINEARSEFDQMDRRDVVAWSAMIAGCAQNGRPEMAVELFDKMLLENVKPNEVTVTSVVSACTQVGSVQEGERIGSYAADHGFASSIYVQSALLDMYAKCGNISKAVRIFNDMQKRDVVTWNSMIHGLAYNGLVKDAITLYRQMIDSNVKPTDLTFISLISACTHSGLVDIGLELYDSMKHVHKIAPKVEHYSCIVDLLCRSGRLEEAYNLICKMEVESNVITWGALLSACRVHSNVDLAECAMKRLLVLEPDNSANYVALASIYDAVGRWKDATRMRDLMKDKGILKTHAYSWLELDAIVHKFLAGDTYHPLSDQIYDTIDGLQLNSYSSSLDPCLMDADSELI